MSEVAVRSIQSDGMDPRPVGAVDNEVPQGLPGVAGWKWLRELRNVPSSRLHARRRRAAQIRLAGIRPRSILFVCHGNICRSPFAAAAFVRSCPARITNSIKVASAGFIGPDRPAPSKALAAASRRGVDISSHRSALVTLEAVQASDLVVVMSEEQERDIRARVSPSTLVLVLGDLDPLPASRRTILDPWGAPDAAFDASYDRIERCVRELARIVTSAD
jgi:protein-tyrosine phosphatase